MRLFIGVLCVVSGMLLVTPLTAEDLESTPTRTPDSEDAPRSSSERITPPRGTKVVPEEENVDLIGDKPGAQNGAASKQEFLPVIKSADPLNQKAREAYRLIAEIKSNFDQISKDLDDGGKEITRLINTSDKVAGNVTTLANLWPENRDFRDQCGNAKRAALLLNDELSRAPRRWTHVRWAFNSAVQELRRLRPMARDLAEAEPKPVPMKMKDGTIVYVEPEPLPIDPKVAESERKLKEAREVKERMRRAEEAQKDKGLKTSLDD